MIAENTQLLVNDEQLKQIIYRVRKNKIKYWPELNINSAIFKAKYPDQIQLLKMADLAVKEKIQFWHPWHMELTHSVESLVKPKEWFIARNGDQEWVDSFARFTHMFDLAAAYKITADEKYLVAFSIYLESFSKARKVQHRHWKDQLNASIRVSNLIKSVDLLNPQTLPEKVLENIIKEIFIDCQFLYSGLGQKVGNWEVAITTSLLIAAEYLKGTGILEVDSWSKDAHARLSDILSVDIHQDGVQIEEVPLYHGEVLLMLFDYLIILITNGIEPDEEVLSVVDRMLYVLEEIADPEGKIPPIGDSDRFPVSYLFKISEILIGKKTINCDQVEEKKNSVSSLKVFKNTGWTVVKWLNKDSKQRYLCFDCSGKPYPDRSWHSHADDLNFIFHTSEGPLITDPGRFTYASEFPVYLPGTNRRLYGKGWKKVISWLVRPSSRHLNSRNWREFFNSTLAHNTVSCDGNQPGYNSPKEAGCLVRQLKSVLEGPLFLLEGELDTSKTGKNWREPMPRAETDNAYQHRRGIYGSFSGIVVVIDRFECNQHRDWVNSVHFSSRVKLEFSEGEVNACLGKSFFLVKCLSKPGKELKQSLEDSWISEVYNSKEPSKTLRTKLLRQKKGFFVTIIIEHEKFKQCDMHVECISDLENENLIGVFIVEKNNESERKMYINLTGQDLYFDELIVNSDLMMLDVDKNKVEKIYRINSFLE